VGNYVKKKAKCITTLQMSRKLLNYSGGDAVLIGILEGFSAPVLRVVQWKMEAASSSEMSVTNYQSTQCHIPTDFNVNQQICENLKPHQDTSKVKSRHHVNETV
jgi:hypothetical protein